MADNRQEVESLKRAAEAWARTLHWNYCELGSPTATVHDDRIEMVIPLIKHNVTMDESKAHA